MLANRCFLCHIQEPIDHILLHCDKVRILWLLLFSLFGISQMLPSSVKETLLGWRDYFVKRKRKKVWGVASLCLFWTIQKEGNRRYFDNKEFSNQWLKTLFLCNLLSSTKLYIVEGPMWLFDFLDWLAMCTLVCPISYSFQASIPQICYTQTFGGGKGMEVVVGRCILEDLSKIGS